MKKLMSFIVLGMFLSGVLIAGEPLKAGDKASDFSLRNTDGKYVSLSQFKDAKGFIVVFTCNTCPVAKKYEQRIIDLQREFGPKGYPVIAINSNDSNVSPGDSFEEMKKLAASKNYGFPYLYDETQSIAKMYGATNTPHAYVLSKMQDHLMVEYIGAIDNNSDDISQVSKRYVYDAVNRLLSGQKVAVSSTKAVGCSIKWRKA